MSVYVDDMRAPFQSVPWKRAMKMCHMIADSSEELLAIAERLGLQRKWIQHANTAREHFDICLSKRKLAVKLGAIEITQKELAKKVRGRAELWLLKSSARRTVLTHEPETKSQALPFLQCGSIEIWRTVRLVRRARCGGDA